MLHQSAEVTNRRVSDILAFKAIELGAFLAGGEMLHLVSRSTLSALLVLLAPVQAEAQSANCSAEYNLARSNHKATMSVLHQCRNLESDNRSARWLAGEGVAVFLEGKTNQYTCAGVQPMYQNCVGAAQAHCTASQALKSAEFNKQVCESNERAQKKQEEEARREAKRRAGAADRNWGEDAAGGLNSLRSKDGAHGLSSALTDVGIESANEIGQSALNTMEGSFQNLDGTTSDGPYLRSDGQNPNTFSGRDDIYVEGSEGEFVRSEHQNPQTGPAQNKTVDSIANNFASQLEALSPGDGGGLGSHSGSAGTNERGLVDSLASQFGDQLNDLETNSGSSGSVRIESQINEVLERTANAAREYSTPTGDLSESQKLDARHIERSMRQIHEKMEAEDRAAAEARRAAQQSQAQKAKQSTQNSKRYDFAAYRRCVDTVCSPKAMQCMGGESYSNTARHNYCTDRIYIPCTNQCDDRYLQVQ